MIFNCDCGNTISKRKTNSWCKLSETIPRQMSVFFLFFLLMFLYLSQSSSIFPRTFAPDSHWAHTQTAPCSLKIVELKNLTRSHLPRHRIIPWCHTWNRAFFCMRRLCVRRAYLCLHRHCVESQSAEVTASMLYSLTGSQNSLCWGNCTLQDKQPTVSHSSASAPTANPGASLRGTAPQHPHSFRKGMWWSVLALMRLFSVIKYSTALFHRAVPPRHLS